MEEVEVKTNPALSFYGASLLVRYLAVTKRTGKKLVVNMEDTIDLSDTGCVILLRAANNEPDIEFSNVSQEIREQMDRLGKIIKEAEVDGPGTD